MSRIGKAGKPLHQADLYALAQIAAAVSYAVWFRKSPRELHRQETATLAEARAIANRWNADFGQFGRRSIVYAVLSTGASTPVPDDYVPSA